MTDFFFTDTHFGCRNHSMTWWKSQRDFIYEQFIPTIKKYDEVRVIHLGDVYDSRSGINMLIAKGTRKMFEDIAALDNVKEVIIIAGNHDFYSPNNDEVCSIEVLLHDIPKTRLVLRKCYETDTEIFVPWYEAEFWLGDIMKNKKTIYTHTDITRGTYESPIFSGHIHYPVFRDNIFSLGSCYALTFADANQSRYFYIKEEGKPLEKIANDISIKFWRFYNEEILNDINLNPNDYIELYVTQQHLAEEQYQSRINDLRTTYKNVWIIPQRDELEIQSVDITMDMQTIIENSIPDNLKEKFDIIKQRLN